LHDAGCVGRGGVGKGSHAGGPWHGFLQQLEPFRLEVRSQVAHAGDIPAWRGQARDEPRLDRIARAGHDNGDGADRVLRRTDREASCGHNEVHPEVDELGRMGWEAVQIPFRKSRLEGDIFPLNPAQLTESLPEWRALQVRFRGRETDP
jgi:hypothetical protein